MNNQIKLLADHAKAYANQCTKDIDGDVSWHWMEYYTEKFAELIVRECAEVIFETPVKYTEIDIMHIIRDRVREHFGVEP